jgi:DNA-binding NarL/FixJ family response regulator
MIANPFGNFFPQTCKTHLAHAFVGKHRMGWRRFGRPNLILLDIGLPTLNGIEAARRIRKVSPESKILFVSQEFSAEVVQEALGLGARGYVVKADARHELLEGVNAVLRGKRFVGRRFSGHDFVGTSHAGA